MEAVDQAPYSLYKHTFPNGKQYIGITKQKPNKRWANGNGYRSQPKIFNAIQHFGWETVRSEVLKTGLHEQEAQLMETVLIHLFNSANAGYNDASESINPSIVIDALLQALRNEIVARKSAEFARDTLWKIAEPIVQAKNKEIDELMEEDKNGNDQAD